MSEQIHVIAGPCATVFEGIREQQRQGDMLVVVNPDLDNYW